MDEILIVGFIMNIILIVGFIMNSGRTQSSHSLKVVSLAEAFYRCRSGGYIFLGGSPLNRSARLLSLVLQQHFRKRCWRSKDLHISMSPRLVKTRRNQSSHPIPGCFMHGGSTGRSYRNGRSPTMGTNFCRLPSHARARDMPPRGYVAVPS